jgi:predicted RecB family nuclease
LKRRGSARSRDAGTLSTSEVGLPATITASMLYDLVHCPHRVALDLFGDPSARDRVSSFVQLLWENGSRFERATIERLSVPFTDLSSFSGDEKERRTREAIARGDALIYAGRLTVDDLVGQPDLLRRDGDHYVPGDIKSGAGEEGHEDDARLKPHYAMQIALYVDVLRRSGRLAGLRGFVWDIDGREVEYDLSLPRNSRSPTTWWQGYEELLTFARSIATKRSSTIPANSSICKQCHWRSACATELTRLRDLTLIPELGRAKRDLLMNAIPTIDAFASADVSTFRVGKKTQFPGIGIESLNKFQRRAGLLTSPASQPYLRDRVQLPSADHELFFDIEVDPMRNHCYLHGFVERRGGDNTTEQYHGILAPTPTNEAERDAFARAWDLIQQSQPCAIYYYAPYERTKWRALQRRHPSVCSASAVEELFASPRTVDLYSSVVRPATEWPTWDYSLKTLAKYLGFRWRDPDPSGASSIEWFHRWAESGDLSIKQRILDYNEDDCRATRVLLDCLRTLEVRS